MEEDIQEGMQTPSKSWDLAFSTMLRSPPARACRWSTKKLLSLLLETLMGDLLYARGCAHNIKALKMDLESEIRTRRDFSSGVESEVGGVKQPCHVEAEPGLDRRLPDSCFWSLCFHVPSWQKGVGSGRVAELETLICK